jgi:hypothetical protein
VSASTKNTIIDTRLIAGSHAVVYDLRQAQDLQERPGIDIFAVFHFHINDMSLDPGDAEEPLYPAVQMAHVFHGQRVYNANTDDADNSREWRVDFGLPPRVADINPTERTLIYQCPYPDVWYPGDPGTRQAASLAQQFGVMLRDRGTKQRRVS